MKYIKRLAVIVSLSVYHFLLVAHATEVEGFLHAQFGDSETIVIESIKADFGKNQEINFLPEDATTGTKTLKIKVNRLEPINLPATISYIFGHRCKCLIQVSAVWPLPKNITPKERNQFLQIISDMSKNFANKTWENGEVFTGRVSGEIKENQVTNYFFFRGVAADQSAITVWGAPVIIVKNNSKQPSLTANIDSLDTLGVNYELNVKRPDLKRTSTQNYNF